MPFIILQHVDLAREDNFDIYDGQLEQGDSMAHEWNVRVKENGVSADLTGYSAICYGVREDGKTPSVKAFVDGGTVRAVFDGPFYNFAGALIAQMVIASADGATITLATLALGVHRTRTGELVTSDERIVDLNGMMAILEETKLAAKAAQDAASEANAAAESANTAAGRANTAAAKIEGMTVSAQAGTGAAAEISEKDGAKHIAFVLPKGKKGDPGNTPYIGENGNWWVGDEDTGTKAQGPAGQNGTGAGTVTGVKVGSTTHEPDETGVVDLGDLSIYAPVRGTDYWTEADIAQIKGYVDDAILGGAW